MYHKLNQKNKRYNDDDEEDDENDDESGDFDVSEISDSDHQCYDTELIDRKQCGANNKPCENDIYGMPRKLFAKALKNILTFFFSKLSVYKNRCGRIAKKRPKIAGITTGPTRCAESLHTLAVKAITTSLRKRCAWILVQVSF